MKYTNESGRSMVEMLGVLAIIGVLSVGGIAGYSKAMNKYKINKTTDQVSMLVANIRTMFTSQGNYDGLEASTAVSYGLVPNDMIKKTDAGAFSSLTNAFAGEVTIVTDKARASGADAEAFVIEYSGMTEEACVAMLTGDWGSDQGSGLISVAGGKFAKDGAADEAKTIYTDDQDAAVATTDKVIGAPGGDVNVPVTVAQAVAACTGGNSGNAVAWKYY